MAAKERIIPLGVRIPAVSPNIRAEVLDRTSAHFLSATRCAKQLFLVGGSVDFQQIPLVAALVQADTALGELDEVILCLIQLEHLHIAALVGRVNIKRDPFVYVLSM